MGLEVLMEPATVLGARERVGRRQLGEDGVAPREFLVDSQDPLGDLKADSQFLGVGRLGEEVVGACSKAFEAVLATFT